MATLEETVTLLKDPTLREEFSSLPIDRQAAVQEEILGKVIVDPDFQTLMRTNQDRAINVLEDFRATMPLKPEQYPMAKKGFFEPRLTMEEIKGPSGQAALATGLATSTVGGVPGFVVGAVSSLLAEEGTKRLQEEFGPEKGLILGLIGSLLTGGKIGVSGKVTPKAPPALAAERGGKAATEIAQEAGGVKQTEFPPEEPPKAFTRPPSGQLPPELGEHRVSLQAAADVKNAVIENVQALTQTESSEKGRRVM